MKKWVRCLLWSCALMLGLAVVPVWGQSYGFVRFSEILARHPRIQEFNPVTRRFNTGPSTPILAKDAEQKKKQFLGEIANLESLKMLQKSRLEAGMKGSAAQKQAAEANYWKEVKALDQAIREKRNAVSFISSAMEFGGQTLEITILPEISRVNSAVTTALQRVAARRGCQVVFNEPVPSATSSEPEVIQNGLRTVFAKEDSEQGRKELRDWLNQRFHVATRFSGRLNLLRPVLIGGVDLTEEVIKEVKTGPVTGGKGR